MKLLLPLRLKVINLRKVTLKMPRKRKKSSILLQTKALHALNKKSQSNRTKNQMTLTKDLKKILKKKSRKLRRI